MNPKIYRQADSRWGSLPYPTKAYSFAGNGCGCCACTHNIIEIPKYANYTPKDVRPYMVAQGFATKGHGTTWDGITKTLEHYGMTVATPNINSSMKGAWDLLNIKGAPKQGVLLFRAGTRGGVRWTSGGHYVAFLDYKVKDGKHWFYTKDSGGRKHDKWFCYETTMRGLLPKIYIVTKMPTSTTVAIKKATTSTKKASTKPSATYTGVIPTNTIKKGAKGYDVKSLQTFLNWYGKYGLKVDGICGDNTVKAIKDFQKKEGLTVDGIYGAKSQAKAKVYKKVEQTVVKPTAKATTTTKPVVTVTPSPSVAQSPVVAKAETYTGKFPTDNNNRKIINGLAYRYCYPYGTKSTTYMYKGGKPRPAYTKAIEETYPNHESWSSNRQKKGACCDVLVGTCLGHVKIKVNQNLAKQLVDMPKMTTQLKKNGIHNAGDFCGGMVAQRGRKDKSGHTWVVFEDIHGNTYIANAHYKHLNGCYACMDAKPKTINPKDWKYYQCYTPLGAIRTTYHKGDYGYDVLYIQKFLKWCGYDVTLDGDFGEKTEEALKKFQTKVGLTADGIWGAKTLAKAKAYKRTKATTATALPKKCIDVSYWQGKISQVNWEKIKKTCGYAICRASYTSQDKFKLAQDSTFATNFVNAKAAGLKVGAYHYSQAITVAEAKAEAEYLCHILKNYTPTFYVVCDFEFGGRLNSKIGTKASDIANAFCDVVKAHGYKPCIYANTSTLNNYLKNPKYPVWVAQYAKACTYKGAKVMWQYTSSGRVDGISAKNTNNKSANVDLSYVY